ncbi:MAG: PadR family transcriptional regulator [Desulfurococcales archaeon]|nr:PadR family transcriptional regulator [Desulfurococcales archaeon]MEB3779512.1 PadR family transcriptional regulator [Desulfurococcales archaeon]
MIDAEIPQRLLKGITVGSLWMYVLTVLLNNPSYPYDVRKMIKEKFGFEPPIVTLYTTFYRLEREGLIRKEEGVYKVTMDGLRILRSAIQVLRRLADVLDESSKHVSMEQ